MTFPSCVGGGGKREREREREREEGRKKMRGGGGEREREKEIIPQWYIIITKFSNFIRYIAFN